MTEVLQGQALVDKLHADHLASIEFMNVVAERVVPLYDAWRAEQTWHSVPLAEYAELPAVWRGYVGVGEGQYKHIKEAVYDDNVYVAAIDSKDLITANDKYNQAIQLGLQTAVHAGMRSLLYADPEGEYGIEPEKVYRSQTMYLGLITALEKSHREISTLGETILTNIGEGERAAYERLHRARLRLASLTSTLLAPELENIAVEYPNAVSCLSRTLVDQQNPLYVRPEVDPLIDMVMEGNMTIGQATNELVQPGVDGQISTEEDIREILRSRLPLLYARLLTNGSIGPNQMMGLGEPDTLQRTPDGLQLHPAFRQRLLDDRTRLRQENGELEGDLLEFMQLPVTQVINRYEGCPATRLVKLGCRMLLDAFEAETM